MSRALAANVTRARIVAALTKANGAAMTEAELAAAANRAPGTIHKHLYALRAEGVITWDPPRKRTARIVPSTDQRSYNGAASNAEARVPTTSRCACAAESEEVTTRSCARESLSHGRVEVKIRFDIATISAAFEPAEDGAWGQLTSRPRSRSVCR